MIVEELKKSILECAITGGLTVQDEKENAKLDLEKIVIGKNEYINKYKLLDNNKYKVKTPNKKIPDNWIWTSVGELCFVTKLAGFEYTKYMAGSLSNEGDVPVVRAQNIKPNLFIDKCTEFISKELSNQLYRCALDCKCTLMTFIGAGIGETAIFDKDTRYHLAPNVAKIVPGLDINKYLLYYFMSPTGKAQVFQYVKQTAQPSLSMETIRSVAVPLPPLSEINRIVDKIEELFLELDEIEPIEKQLDELKLTFPEKMKKSILMSAMKGNLSEQNNDERVHLKVKEIVDESIPNNWVRTKAKNILNIVTGKKDANYGSEDGKYLFYTCASEPILSKTYSFEGKNLILPGNGANVGLAIYTEEKFEAYQRTYVVSSIMSEKDIYLKYIYYYFCAFWNEYNRDKMFGSAIPYIKLGNLQNFEINIPPIEEQYRIVEKLESILPIIESI